MSPTSTTVPDSPMSLTADSLSLLERIGVGDQDAVSECIARYGDLIWYLSRKFSSTSADAEDATQEIFVELWQKARSFDRSLSSEETFVAMIARRRLIDRRRRMNTDLCTVTMDLDQSEPMEDQMPDLVETRDEAAKAAQCMEKLSPEQQTVLSLSIHHGHSHSAISNHMHLPLGTVKSFARRGLLQLRDCMNRNAMMLSRSGSL